MYSFEYLDLSVVLFGKNTDKGEQKARKNRLTFDDYELCLKINTKLVQMNSIRLDHHELFTYNINKIGLPAFDDKRFILDDGITALAHGHHRIIVNSLS